MRKDAASGRVVRGRRSKFNRRLTSDVAAVLRACCGTSLEPGWTAPMLTDARTGRRVMTGTSGGAETDVSDASGLKPRYRGHASIFAAEVDKQAVFPPPCSGVLMLQACTGTAGR
jgi:hypothetical protein